MGIRHAVPTSWIQFIAHQVARWPAWLIRWNDPALSLGSYSRDSSLGILGKDQLEVVTGWGLNSSCLCFLFGRFGGKVVAGTQVLFENVKWFQDFLWIQYGSEVNKISQPHPQRGFHDFFRACRLFQTHVDSKYGARWFLKAKSYNKKWHPFRCEN